MTYFIVFVGGLLLSAMQSLNGRLSVTLGAFGTSLVVHLIGGVLLAAAIVLVLRQKLRLWPMPWYLYGAGLLGIALVTCNSVVVALLGPALTSCLSISGQLFFSILLDHFGLLGMRKTRFDVRRLPALAVIAVGLVLVTAAS